MPAKLASQQNLRTLEITQTIYKGGYTHPRISHILPLLRTERLVASTQFLFRLYAPSDGASTLVLVDCAEKSLAIDFGVMPVGGRQAVAVPAAVVCVFTTLGATQVR